MQRIVQTLLVLLLMTTACFGQELPGIKRDRQFDALMKYVDLERLDHKFVYKKSGSSVGLVILDPSGSKVANFVPYNSSSDPEAEVVSYRLARFLGVSDIYYPVTYYELGPIASGRFKAMLRKNYEPNDDRDRQLNHGRIVQQLNTHPTGILGIYRERIKGKKYFAQSLCYGGEEAKLNTEASLMARIRANGPKPTDKLISLPGVKGLRPGYPKPVAKESELARQLSIILVIDQLMGQWDRCMGNLEAIGDINGRLQLLARDNGGADVNDGWEWHSLHQRWVSRYDRLLMDNLRSLNAFLKGRAQFAGYKDVNQWKTAVGFRKESAFKTFKRKLELLVEKQVPSLEKQHGAGVYFEAKADGVSPAGTTAAIPAAKPEAGAKSEAGANQAATAKHEPAAKSEPAAKPATVAKPVAVAKRDPEDAAPRAKKKNTERDDDAPPKKQRKKPEPATTPD